MLEYYTTVTGVTEIAASVASLICVYLIIVQSRWNFFWGAVGVGLFAVVFYEFKLYSDMLLQLLFFLPIQYVGWYQWTYGGPRRDTLVISSNNRLFWLSVASGALFVALWGTLMHTYTDAAAPYLDSVIVACSVFAQLLMNKKIIQSWWIWIGMDVYAIWFFWYKELYVTSGLYVVFLGLATVGYLTWKEEYRGRLLKA